MIALDANILVRCFAQDDPIQSPKATEIIERRLTAENRGFVSIVAMVETVWVLDSACGLADGEIANASERAIQANILVVENEQEVFSGHDHAQGRTGLIRRCPNRSARRESWLRPNAHI
jgi:predicted nucleic-acid-binding protein